MFLKKKHTVSKVCHHSVSRIEFPSIPQRTKAYNQYQYVFASADDRSQHFTVKLCRKIRSKKSYVGLAPTVPISLKKNTEYNSDTEDDK